MENITFIIPLNSDNKGPIFVQKTLKGLIFGGAHFRRGLLSEGILRFKMG